MKRARETESQFCGILTNVINALNTRPTPPAKDPSGIPIRWLALREKAKAASEENSFILKWAMMVHLFEQEEVPCDVFLGVVGPLFIHLITVPSMQGMTVRLYEPLVLIAMRMNVDRLSFFYNNQRYTIRKAGRDYLELLKHCHPESEGGQFTTCNKEHDLLTSLDTLCNMAFVD